MKSVLLVSFFMMAVLGSTAQDSTVKTKYKIAIFAPLYLDSAFDAQTSEYRYAKNIFPKFITSGLEFYEGAQLALDSLSQEGAELEVFVFDTRAANKTIDDLLNDPKIADVDLIITHCSSNEVRMFAEAGLRNSIPVINTTIPNDGGTSSNPYFVVLNPTLKTQIEGVYKFVQKNYSVNPVIVFRKKGGTEDHIKSIFEEYGKSTMGTPVKIRYVDLTDSFSVEQLRAVMDSTKKSICISGTLDVNFGRRLTAHLASLNKSYTSVVIGMPTWEGIREFSRPEFKGIEIIYSNPFYNTKTDKVSQGINTYFTSSMYSRPSDMVFRGYEVTWKFAKLLLQYGKDLSSNLGNKQHKVFTDFDIQPVLSKNSSLQYFENKKLYFIKWQDGVIKSVY